MLLCGKTTPIAATLNNDIFLMSYSQLYGKHFCEIIAFLIVNILTTVYAGVEGKGMEW